MTTETAARYQGPGRQVLKLDCYCFLAAPAVGRVPGSAAFAERYTKRFGPIANYAVNSYDAARSSCWPSSEPPLPRGPPDTGRCDRRTPELRCQGIAYARPVEWDAMGNMQLGHAEPC